MNVPRSATSLSFKGPGFSTGRAGKLLFLLKSTLFFLFFASYGSSAIFAQRYSPVASSWLNLESTHPLGQSLTSADGSLIPGGTTDSGFFKHLSVKEGDEIKACLVATSTTGVSGLMVRDSADPSAPFVFGGIDATGNRVMYWRHLAGGPIQEITFPSAPSGNKWLRLLVGTDTVYFYDAAQIATAKPGTWSFRGAVKIDLNDADEPTEGSDLGGLFVSGVGTSFSDLFKTSRLIWSERTTRVEDLTETFSGWADYPPEEQFTDSTADLLARTATGAGNFVEFPLDLLKTQTASQPQQIHGVYELFVHAVAGTGMPLCVQVVRDGNVQSTDYLKGSSSI